MNARIALVSADSGRRDARSPWPHYGLTLLPTALQAAGHDARVFDQSYLRMSRDEFVGAVARFSPGLVGISLYTTYVRKALGLVRELRARLPGCHVIAGGPHVSLYAEDMRADTTFAALVNMVARRRLPTKAISG